MKLSPHFTRVIIPIHLVGLYALFRLLSAPQLSSILLILIGWTLISGLGVAVGLHRYLSHKSFKTSLRIEKIISLLGALGGQGSPIFWVALHRLHHIHSDTSLDIHSPVNGKWSSYLGWQIRFDHRKFSLQHAKNLARDPWQKWLHRNYETLIHLTLAASVLIPLDIGLNLIALPMLYSIHQENIINLFCHMDKPGLRPQQTGDNSRNIRWLTWFTWGQSLHNNHHAFPSRANFACHRHEFDPAMLLVRLIRTRSNALPHTQYEQQC